VTFWAPGGARMTTEDAVMADVIKRAADRWPAAVSVIDLARGDDMPQMLPAICGSLLTLYATTNLVQLHAHPPAPATTAGERPLASPLARIQARDQPEVANLRHVTVPLDDGLLRRLLVLLDGTRDRDALLAELGGVDPDTLEAALQRLGRSSLLVS
jgi:hypothetical protein